MLRRSVELEARIIDDLLDLTRIAKGMLSFSPEDTDVHELSAIWSGCVTANFAAKNWAVSLDSNAEMHHVYTDAGRLAQVLWNVLEKRRKIYRESGGNVSICHHRTTNKQKHRYQGNENTGIGMAPETLSRLFTPFEQGEQLISRRYGGLGLGMAISSALVELLGGSLTCVQRRV